MINQGVLIEFIFRFLIFQEDSEYFLYSDLSEILICSMYLETQYTNLRAHLFKVKHTKWYKVPTPGYLNPKWISEILSRIRDPRASVPLRPSLREDKVNEKIVVLVRACWDELPEKRPTFLSIKKILRDASPKG